MVLFLALIISFLSLQAVRSAGNIACADSGLDWYTNAVGETPCQTYEQLRQICNPKFAVGVMNSSLPPDVCDDPESSCCCNSVAFGLSMLCLNCQKGTEPTGVSVDATPGTYGKYLGGIKTNGSCTPVVNQTLPTNVQTSICDTRLKILDPLYARLYWSDGSWFYGYSSNLLISNISATDGNDFTRCASTTINVTFSAALPSSSTVFPSSLPSTSASSNASSSASTNLSVGAIAGIAVGATLVTIGVVLVLWFLYLKWKINRGKQEGLLRPEPFTVIPRGYLRPRPASPELPAYDEDKSHRQNLLYGKERLYSDIDSI